MTIVWKDINTSENMSILSLTAITYLSFRNRLWRSLLAIQ